MSNSIGRDSMLKGCDENIARKIHTHIDVLHGKLRHLESYLTDGEDFKCDVPESKDVVEEAIVDLVLCIDCVDRTEEILKKIK